MGDKVWVIPDPDEYFAPKKRAAAPVREQENPAVAFSLSLICWGSGQFYIRQWRNGILFFLLMLNFVGFLIITIIFWREILPIVKSWKFTKSDLLLACMVFYVLGLIVWIANALHAYWKTDALRTVEFKGVEKKVLPALCSFILPGWGQMLNGQPRKGFFYLLIALLGLTALPSLPIIYLLWPNLEPSPSKNVLDLIFGISFLLAPVLVFFWFINVFDAFKVAIDSLKKEPLLKRMQYATTRVRLQGGFGNFIAESKGKFLLILIFILCVLALNHFFPKKFYVSGLQGIGQHLSHRGMTVIPLMIEKGMETLDLK